MKITVELSENELDALYRMTGLRKKGPAIRRVLEDALRMQRRAEISGKFLTGEWSAELGGFEEGEERDRTDSHTLSKLWRA